MGGEYSRKMIISDAAFVQIFLACFLHNEKQKAKLALLNDYSFFFYFSENSH